MELTLAGFASLTMRHVVEDVLHGAAVRQSTGSHLPVGLLPTLALVCVEQQDQLLLDQLALLRIGRWARRRDRHSAAVGQWEHRCLLLWLLLEMMYVCKEKGGGKKQQINQQIGNIWQDIK